MAKRLDQSPLTNLSEKLLVRPSIYVFIIALACTSCAPTKWVDGESISSNKLNKPNKSELSDDPDRIARGAALVLSCSGCHSPTNEVLPDLGSFTKRELKMNLLAFKSGTRNSTLMNRLAAGYSDADLELLAEVLGR